MSNGSGEHYRRSSFVADPWVANSLMQKAIRRGEAEIAQWAAASFHILRGSAIWRRLIIIACEDIGLGSIDAVTATVRACTDLSYRRANGGNARVIADVVRQLALAEKDRSADHLIAAAAEHPKLEAARRRMASLELAGRLALLADAELPITVRAVAAWYSSGLEWDRERRISGGDVRSLLRSYAMLGVPEDLLAALALAAGRTREPLTLLLPLLWLYARAHTASNAQAEITLLPPSEDVYGVPLYAFDLHTRIGRQALQTFWHENVDVRAAVARSVPGRSGLHAVQLAAFHVDSGLIDRPFEWPLRRKIDALGIETDLLSAGVVRERHAAMLEAVRRNLGHLNQLRKSIYRQVFTRVPA